MVYAIGMLGFWICGFALQMGGVGAVAALGRHADAQPRVHDRACSARRSGLFGITGFFLTGDAYDVGVLALFLFQMVFMDTAATIPTGAMAERWKFSAFVVFGFFMSMFIYPLYGNWVWGGGWLAELGRNFGLGHGHVDFAGSSVVHMVGGVARARRRHRSRAAHRQVQQGRHPPNPIPGHNIPMADPRHLHPARSAGSASTPGSTLAGTDVRIAVVAVNTMLASAGGRASPRCSTCGCATASPTRA